MAKKKSKMQKKRHNNRKKVVFKKEQNKKPQIIDKNKVKYNVYYNHQVTKKPNPLKEFLNKFKLSIKIPKITLKTVFTTLKNNIHIIFNSVLLVIFFTLIFGLLKTEVFTKTINIYIILILAFFILIAISYNKYKSGKVFTLILSIIMSIGILYLNNTFAYINSINSSYYETKTYYIVTFDNNLNKNLYSINNKSIGLLSYNHQIIENIIDTKVDAARYKTYDDINSLFNDFYNEKTRAVILNENQYKYLENNIDNLSRTIKVLYEFNATSLK